MSTITQKPDTNFISYADTKDVVVEGITFQPTNPEFYDDILKISKVEQIVVRNCIINPKGGNREDGVDINRLCKDVSITDCTIGSGDKYAVTIKGGCVGVELNDVEIVGRGGWERVDIDLGNYSDSNMIRTRGIELIDVRRQDGQPVRVRCGLADRPLIYGGHVKVLFWQSLMIKAYVWGKYALVRLGLIGWER